MEYAIYAHIDYFAYVWYEDVMKTAREFHTQSKYKNDVKMCACIDSFGKDFARRDMEKLFLESYYMKVLGGRPLMYYFGRQNNLDAIKDDILYYRDLTKRLGIPEPYAVIMNVSPQQARDAYGDAVSTCSIFGFDNEPFSTVAERAYSLWGSFNASEIPYVPTVSLGWNPEPRYINPVSWNSVPNNSWAKLPRADEIEEHWLYALSFMAHPSVYENTPANVLLAYAWNEHDEGGWLCPTIVVDKDGNQIYNTDGSKKINAERIEAVKNTVEAFDNGKCATVDI